MTYQGETIINKITPLKKLKRSDEVTLALEDIIKENKLQPGDKLPSQADLSRNLEVGTRSIREAIKVLESRGMLETRPGKGVFVKSNNLDFFMESLMGSLLFKVQDQKDLMIDLTKVRQIVESHALYDLAAQPKDVYVSRFAELIDTLDSLGEKKDIDTYNVLDYELHKLIIESTENKILIIFFSYLSELQMRVFSKAGYVRGSLEESMADHHAMLDAIIEQNPERAKKIIERHLKSTLNKVMEIDAVVE